MKAVKELIQKAGKTAVLTHISEDADALGTAAALKTALENVGVCADIYISEEPEERLSFMNVDTIVYTEEAPTLKYDLCICVDCADIKRLGSRVKIFENAEKTVNIDHHVTNNEYADENIVDGSASSAAEVLYGLLEYMQIEITREIAFYLYTAIASDSGCFKYECASPKTMRIAAKLMEKEIDHAYICRKLFDTEKRDVMKLNGHIMENIREYADGKICVVTLDADTQRKYNVEEKNTGDIVNIARRTEGCEIAVSVREARDKIKVSLRSNGKYNVAEIASEYGGGGHEMAAGITFNSGNIQETEQIIVDGCIKKIEGDGK